MNKISSTFGLENLPSIDEIYNNLFSLIDLNIENFKSFLKEAEAEYKKFELIKKNRIVQEDDITMPFGRFFRNLNSEYDFENQSKTPESNATTDIGVIAKKYSRHKVICFVEAKRLPTSTGSNRQETEYVCYKESRKQGGIERFKTERHAGKEKLKKSIMLGYIQENNSLHWYSKVNSWIDSEIKNPSKSDIIWNAEDKLISDNNFTKNYITKYHSIHSRKGLSKIELTHYWIDLQ